MVIVMLGGLFSILSARVAHGSIFLESDDVCHLATLTVVLGKGAFARSSEP